MSETEEQARKIKKEDFKKIEDVSATSKIVIDQINKVTSNLDTLNRKGETCSLFIAMKRADSQISSLEQTLDKLDKDNTLNVYKLETDQKLSQLITELKLLGHFSLTLQAISQSNQMEKRPSFEKDIKIKTKTEERFGV